MTYYADLSPHEYTKRAGLNVGWLDDSRAFPTAVPDPKLVACLNDTVTIDGLTYDSPVDRFRGYHLCQFCSGPDIVNHRYAKASGNGSIVVEAVDGTVFVAPALLPHYVSAHHYDPPAAFKEALLRYRHAIEGPLLSKRPRCPCGRLFTWGPLPSNDNYALARYYYQPCTCGMTVRHG